MESDLSSHIDAYRQQMLLGAIPKAYRALLKYMQQLRVYFSHTYPDGFVTGSLYQGYMDITYFPFTSTMLKQRKLKVGVVFNHEKVRFEVWLVGQNKQVQKEYWQLFKDNEWLNSSLSANGKHSIVEAVLVETPNFTVLGDMKKKIEDGVMSFIKEVTILLD